MKRDPDFHEILPPGRSRETDIRRDSAGRWYKGDVRIDHVNLTQSFDGWIELAPDGRYCLKNDINWAYVTIEGAPYFVRGVHAGTQSLELQLSGNVQDTLIPSTLRQDAEGGLYCTVRDGVAARFDTHALTQLSTYLEETGDGLYLSFAGNKTPITTSEDPLAIDVGRHAGD